MDRFVSYLLLRTPFRPRFASPPTIRASIYLFYVSTDNVVYTTIFRHLSHYPILTSLDNSPSQLIHMSYSHLHISDLVTTLSRLHFISFVSTIIFVATIITHLVSHLILRLHYCISDSITILLYSIMYL